MEKRGREREGERERRRDQKRSPDRQSRRREQASVPAVNVATVDATVVTSSVEQKRQAANSDLHYVRDVLPLL